MRIRKKRGYSRDLPKELLRDYKLFAITCEGGKREPEYFKLFEHISNRIKVDIIDDQASDEALFKKYQTKSAPKWVLERAITYVEKEGLVEDDELWFVMDVDRWKKEQLYEIIQHCRENKNWNVVLSNPCFEIWLFLHKEKNFDTTQSLMCADFKNEISQFEKEGYNPLNFISLIKEACENAKKIDEDPDNLFPNVKETKVYFLVDSILKFVSEHQFDDFINNKLPKLLNERTVIKKVNLK